MELPDIPLSWLIGFLTLGMIVLAILNIDSWTHAIIGSISGYLIGQHIESARILNTTQTDTPSK
jgi:hypothetical protein